MLRVVIVGSSVAGIRTAQSLRLDGFDGEIVVIGEEAEAPYDKPELSKRLLEGGMAEGDNLLISPEDARVAGIELRLGSAAVSLDPAAHLVELANGSTVEYSTLVIATGARARPAPWGPFDGMYVLRTIDDARRLASDLDRGGRLVVIGGSFIGAEVASTARKRGLKVDIVDPRPIPFARALGNEIGALVGDFHLRNEVATHFGDSVVDVTEGAVGPLGRPTLEVALDSKSILAADTVVVGIGAIPNTEWLEGSGLDIVDGVACDQHLRAIGVSDVFAVGDVARWWHPIHNAQVRVEHWTNAVEQARVVANNIVHPDDLSSFAAVEYVWSDQYGSRLQFVGKTGQGSHVVLRDPQAVDRYVALYSRDDGVFAGAMTVDWPKALIFCRQLVSQGLSLNEVAARLEQSLLNPAAVR